MIFFKMYSDEENRNLEAKLDILSERVKKKLDQMKEEEDKKEEKIKKRTQKNLRKGLQDIIDFLNIENKNLRLCINRNMGQIKLIKKN